MRCNQRQLKLVNFPSGDPAFACKAFSLILATLTPEKYKVEKDPSL